MSNHQAYISLDSVITDYTGEAELSVHKYRKLFDIAFRGMEDLGLDFFYEVQTFKIPVNANLTANTPSNCLQLVKCGVLNSVGEIVPLNSNSKLTTYADLLPNRLSVTQDDTLFNWDSPANSGWFYNYWSQGVFTNLYGLPSGAPFVGSYKYDKINGLIVLDENFQYPYVMAECLVSPVEGQEYYLPIQFREALIAWLWMKDNKMINVKRGAVGINRDLKNEYSNARRVAKARYDPFRIEDAYQASQEQTRMAIKG